MRAQMGICCVQTSDKAVLEEFEEPTDDKAAVTEVVARAVSPATEVGGDARLILPDERRIKSEVAEHDGLVSAYPLSFCCCEACLLAASQCRNGAQPSHPGQDDVLVHL